MNKHSEVTLDGILRAIIGVALLIITIYILVMIYNFAVGTNERPTETTNELVIALQKLGKDETKNLQEIVIPKDAYLYLVSAGKEEMFYEFPGSYDGVPPSLVAYPKKLDRCALNEACACYCEKKGTLTKTTIAGKSASVLSCDRLHCQSIGENIIFPEKTRYLDYFESDETFVLYTGSNVIDGYLIHGSVDRKVGFAEGEHGPERFITIQRYEDTIFLCEVKLSCATPEMKAKIDEEKQKKDKEKALSIFTQFTTSITTCITDPACSEVSVKGIPENYRIRHYNNNMVIEKRDISRMKPPEELAQIPLLNCQELISEYYDTNILSTAQVLRSDDGTCIQKKVEV